MNVVVSKRNLHEIENILRLAARLDFDNVSFLHPIPVDEIGSSLPSPQELSTLSEEYLMRLGGNLGVKVACWFRRVVLPPKALPRCLQPWEHLFIILENPRLCRGTGRI